MSNCQCYAAKIRQKNDFKDADLNLRPVDYESRVLATATHSVSSKLVSQLLLDQPVLKISTKRQKKLCIFCDATKGYHCKIEIINWEKIKNNWKYEKKTITKKTDEKHFHHNKFSTTSIECRLAKQHVVRRQSIRTQHCQSEWFS